MTVDKQRQGNLEVTIMEQEGSEPCVLLIHSQDVVVNACHNHGLGVCIFNTAILCKKEHVLTDGEYAEKFFSDGLEEEQCLRPVK
jgi:hypothetical protein